MKDSFRAFNVNARDLRFRCGWVGVWLAGVVSCGEWGAAQLWGCWVVRKWRVEML
jgi:hypothetical protein